MAISAARRIAFDVLLRVESESAYASELLYSALRPDVNAADAGLATELTLGVLRWRRLLDFLLARHVKKPVARLDLPVALALRLGLYQLRFLDKVPARAAVHESVELVKRARKSSAASLVNAVLRRATAVAKDPAGKLMPSHFPVAERLGILYSHPTWMVQRWLAGLGEAATVALLEANNRTPRLTFALRDPVDRDDVLRELESEGLRVQPGHLLKDAFAASGGSLVNTAAFRSGKIWIADEASQAVPLLLGVRGGNHVLDLCAAPGGKTVALARAAGARGSVVAGDLHEHRLRAMQARFERLRLATAGSGHDVLLPAADPSSPSSSPVQLVALDATEPLPFRVDFDRVLVDAPCSGTGTLAGHPEIRWRLRPNHLAGFHDRQTSLLRNALAHLAPGGRLVYSTCSMEPEENEDVVEAVLVAQKYRALPAAESAGLLTPFLAPRVDPASLLDGRDYFRTSPAAHGTDGFFAAVLEEPR